MKEKGFFAYGSSPASCGDSIEQAIKVINVSQNVDIQSWTSLRISGKYLISKILSSIDECDFFCADLTGLNNNVLFELGYAIARNKIIFLINDVSHVESERRFKELGLLTTFGYCNYTNSDDIIKAFAHERPFDPIEGSLWDSLANVVDPQGEQSALLILNGQIDTNYNQEIVNKAKHFHLPYILDDASESKVQPLAWYIQQIHKVPAILAHFSSDNRVGSEIHNAKCALISGLALGRDLKVKMLAEKPYDTPVDYRDLLSRYSFQAECASITGDFFEKVKNEIAELILNQSKNALTRIDRSQLQKINFGEAIAEHESTLLFTYFVETANINNLIKNEYNIVVGRKGAGKTATLYYLNSLLNQDRRNHVILIKPINFEVDGLISLMESTKNDFERGFLTECIWKFLIFSEIAKSLYEGITSKGLYAVTAVENDFKSYIEERSGLFLSDFSTRLEEQLRMLKQSDIGTIESGNNTEFRLKVSEALHQGTLHELRDHFAKIIPKNHKIIVLIDNLDKSWRENSKINLLSKYILGLLGVSGRILKELEVVRNVPTGLSFHLTLFLRSDIYRYVRMNAREPDKIEVTKLSWDDKEILFRIIEERFVGLSGNRYVATDLWNNFVAEKIDGTDVKDFIMENIFPRPRDIIYVFRSAKDIAVSRGHKSILAEDFKKAFQDYSAWVFTSLIVENGITEKQMEDFMYELMACNKVLTKTDIIQKMTVASIETDDPSRIDKFIDHLVSLSIIGREIKPDLFQFEYDMDAAKKFKTISEKFNSDRFKIHNALVPYLECVE